MIQEDLIYLILRQLKHTPINNPYRLFYNVYYEDTNYKLFDSREFKHKIVKLIVKKENRPETV